MKHHLQSGTVQALNPSLSTIILILLSLAIVAYPAPAFGATWSLQSTPAASRTAEQLESDSCSSERACMAVGSYRAESGATLALTEAWDGSQWAQHAAVQPEEFRESAFSDVSCTSERACTAVGYAKTREFRTTLAPLVERWNGAEWAKQALVTPRFASEVKVYGISCTSSTACTAVGSVTISGAVLPLAETWNGSEWSLQTTPAVEGELLDVSCSSSSACTAVGYHPNSGTSDGALILRWNGSTWNQQRAVSGEAEFTFLLDVSCATSASCVAVGVSEGASVAGAALTEIWNGSGWARKELPAPTGTELDPLQGVSCTSETACMSVGSYRTTPESPARTLAESWNGERWAVVSSPNPRGSGQTEFNSISCTSSVLCTGTGQSDVTVLESLAERYS